MKSGHSTRRAACCLLILAMVFVCTVPIELHAQHKIDVKTILIEKAELKYLLSGVEWALQETSWVDVTEVGEDYSLYLTEIERLRDRDLISVGLVVHLRTPAMFRTGRPLAKRGVFASFSEADLAEFQPDSLDLAIYTQSNRETRETLTTIGKIISFYAAAFGAPLELGGLVLDQSSVVTATSALSTVEAVEAMVPPEVQKIEMFENYLLRGLVVQATLEMIQEVEGEVTPITER